MDDDLEELRERADLAKSKIDQFFASWQKYINEKVIIYYEGHHTANFRISVEVEKALPTALRVEARLIVNEFKSCLDALAVILAIRNGKNPQSVYFPSPKTEEIFLSDGVKNKLSKLSETDRQKIIQLRPYSGGHSFLHPLHEVDRAGMHSGLVLSHGAQQISIGGRTYDMLAWGNPVTVSNSSFDGAFVERLVIWNTEMLPGPRKVICEGSRVSAPVSPIFSLHYSNPSAVNGWNVFWVLREFGKTVDEVLSLFQKDVV